MIRSVIGKSRGGILLTLGILGIISAVIMLPNSSRSKAVGNTQSGSGLYSQTKSQQEELPNYDIRSDKQAYGKIASFRTALNRSAAETADVRDDFARGAEELKTRVPTLKVEYNPELRTPEVITPDAELGRSFLSKPSKLKRSKVLADFLKENKTLVGATEGQVDDLKLFSDYTNPDGNLSFVEYEQEINGIPVFRGEVKASFTKKGELIRVINNLAPGLDYTSLSTDFRDPNDALRAASEYINYKLNTEEASPDAGRSNELKTVYGEGEWSPTAEKIYFPTEPGVAVAAWRVLIWQPLNAYYVIVDAETGTMLWRKNITEDQGQPATYQVYTNPNAMINVAESAAPVPPTVTNPMFGTQGLPLFRSNVQRIGLELPFSFNGIGWIKDGFNTTDGNNVESGLDLEAPNGSDEGTHAVGSPYRVFSSGWNPPPGNPAPGDLPSTAEARRGAVIQQFYIMNLYHDELYRLGFTESARNFQNENFGRGGVGGDRISAEGQDYTGTNNANFGTGVDGIRGRMQMFLWTGPNPARDGTGDADIMIHEVTHGTSNRLHGNAGGLTSVMARAMGEGWSDFYAHCLLSEPTDPLNGTYPLSGYTLFQAFGTVGSQNHFYGIRRFPKAIMSATGGPNNRPYNPLTFADIDQTQANTSDGAFPAMTGAHISSNADQTHAAGEVWSSALWEVRAKMVQRLGWEVGNRRVLQLVTDGMKLSPLNPTFLQARDAILAAAFGSALTTAQLNDAADIWAGFAIRGMGFNANVNTVGVGIGDTRVTQSFELPNLLQLPNFAIADSLGDGDGSPEPGETITITVPLTNVNGVTANGVTAQLVGGNSVDYGTITSSSTASRQFTFTIPVGTTCGSSLSLTLNVNSSLGAKSFSLPLLVGTLDQSYSENFDAVATPFVPAGWATSTVSGGTAWVTSANKADTAPTSVYALDPSTVGGGTDLTSPFISIQSAAAKLTFRNNYNTEPNFDGGMLEISIGGAAFVDILAAGGSFIEGGYNSTLSPSAGNPYPNRQAWSGNSSGFIATSVQLPPSASGRNIQLRWRFGADDNVGIDAGYVGWNIDTVKVFANSVCSFNPPAGNVRSRADFDGDGKTDLSVFRPSEGNWYTKTATYINVSTWGVATDVPVPGDYDGDGKTDLAIFRATPGDAPDFYIIKSNGFVFTFTGWGEPGDKPVIGDYDGDGSDDVAVHRPSDNNWYIRKSTGGFQVFNYGQAGDILVPGKYDGDNKTDFAVFRNGQWLIINSSGGATQASWGIAGDRPVPADFDGDNRDDIAVWRPSDGIWYIRRSSNLQIDQVGWGQNGDIPVPGDYDGDGKDDPAVYRAGIWFTKQSTAGLGSSGWGVASDIPIPSKYIP